MTFRTEKIRVQTSPWDTPARPMYVEVSVCEDCGALVIDTVTHQVKHEQEQLCRGDL